jgi:hypothetical protein
MSRGVGRVGAIRAGVTNIGQIKLSIQGAAGQQHMRARGGGWQQGQDRDLRFAQQRQQRACVGLPGGGRDPRHAGQQGNRSGFITGDPQRSGFVKSGGWAIKSAQAIDRVIGSTNQTQGGVVFPEVVATQRDQSGVIF